VAVHTANAIVADMLILLRHPCWRIVSAESSAILSSSILNTIVTRSIGLALIGPFASILPADEVFGTHSHYIAYFSMSIGIMNYPDLGWRFLTGDLHTVPVGFDGGGQPRMVMDILLFDRMTATESIELTQKEAVCEIDQVGKDQFRMLNALFIENMVPAIVAVANRWAIACHASVNL
jgi:hypothetical protein